MDNQQIEKSLDEQSKQLIRLEERIAVLRNVDERVIRLNNYFQICGVLLLILGIGSGWLTSRFFGAQREIDRLTGKLQDSERLLATQLEAAKKQFDSHVAANPQVANLKKDLVSLQNALGTASPTDQISLKRGTPRTKTCPPGTYMTGISFSMESGLDHGAVYDITPTYKPFLPPTDEKKP